MKFIYSYVQCIILLDKYNNMRMRRLVLFVKEKNEKLFGLRDLDGTRVKMIEENSNLLRLGS